MDNFKDINCRIVSIGGRISCQTGVRVSIFSFCRCINRDTIHVQKKFCFLYMCIALWLEVRNPKLMLT